MKKLDIKYKYIHAEPLQSEYEDKLIPTFLDFKKAREIRSDKDLEFIGSTDDGWATIYKLQDKYYHISEGFPEYEGHVYVTEVELING